MWPPRRFLQHVTTAFVAIVGLGAWCTAHATITAVACYACTNAQFESKAASIANTQRYGYIYLYNLQDGDFRKYHVEAEPIYGGYEYFADEVTPSSTEQASWDDAAQAISNNGGSSTFVSRVSASDSGFPDPGVNAFDVASTAAYVKDISDWIQTGYASHSKFVTDQEDTIAAITAIVSQILLQQNPITITVIVALNDGSSIYMFWQAGYVEYVLTKAYDKSNNPVPLTYNSVAPNNYIFRNGDNGGNLGDYLNNRFDIGIHVLTCYNGTLACVKYGDNQVSCTYDHCDPTP